jgi:hypothetical protein
MTVRELKDEAHRRGITVPPKARKAEIEELLGVEDDHTVVAAVQRDLDSLGRRLPRLPKTALAASALELARQMDDPQNSATSKSMCSRALIETLDRLEELAPPVKEGDRVDELAEKRSSRRSA